MKKVQAQAKLKELGEIKDNKVLITLEVGLDIAKAIEDLNDDSLLVSFERSSKNRTGRQNRYLWELCTLVAEKIGVGKQDVYREHIRRSVLPEKVVTIERGGVQVLKALLRSRGTGWFCEVLDEDYDGMCEVAIYYGSSTFDRAKQNKLLSSLIEEANELNIPTEIYREELK